MLKGHVFKQQIFGNQIFALFINTFLDGANGISNNYKNSMETTYNGSTLTVQSGAVCIQGRFLEEDTSTDIAAGTDSAYCKLVIEIDLSKQNTESDFTQGAYKVIKGASAYPELTQNDIVKNNSGIYQYELARFRTTSNGIADFQDMRTYLDFDSIYGAIQTEYRAMLTELEQELEDVEDGSAFVMKNDFVAIHGQASINVESNSDLNYSIQFDFPEGYTKDNCTVISIGVSNSEVGSFGYGTTSASYNDLPGIVLRGTMGKSVNFLNDKILFQMYARFAGTSEAKTYDFDYKIVLMKLPEIDVSNYELGDVNMDGELTEADLALIQGNILGNIVLTDKQFKLADMNKDGRISASDYVLLRNKIQGNS